VRVTNLKDRLEMIEYMIGCRNIHADDGDLFKLILEELKMLRGRTDSWERFIGSLRKEFQ
jgi:hypothetical protein